jgi:hypothetical protein
MISPEEREAMIQQWLDRTSLPREYAEELVAIGLGEIDGDIEFDPPLTPDQRRRVGLGITMDEALERMNRREKELEQSKTGD